MPEGSLKFGDYSVVRLYNIVVPGRKTLAGDSLQKKKKKAEKVSLFGQN